MPGASDDTRAILQWIRDALGPGAYVNLMDQYYPAGRVGERLYPELNRRVRSDEFLEARRFARALGLERLDERRAHPLLRGQPW
jgi:putative pyruvate formate lyase activating enzyme